ncbi:DNA topoisomerase 1 beta [Selaginella moellendorffii]|uniref:DNA topoisomerase 1 beta n=1 Tax=Selaginella moellendorffii TaxID=88036 RepID=UPI000D1C492F|nr:DNA topoisomerase 1 beta [Selaginella moellendorffii]XP_024539526.1 DNA topoisomerase 1 beta [Selaginella moellendorffii]|eukprot:XP_002978794.2 DNA topoisomerase 1 beta [Selaginella moellendorffii]
MGESIRVFGCVRFIQMASMCPDREVEDGIAAPLACNGSANRVNDDSDDDKPQSFGVNKGAPAMDLKRQVKDEEQPNGSSSRLEASSKPSSSKVPSPGTATKPAPLKTFAKRSLKSLESPESAPRKKAKTEVDDGDGGSSVRRLIEASRKPGKIDAPKKIDASKNAKVAVKKEGASSSRKVDGSKTRKRVLDEAETKKAVVKKAKVEKDESEEMEEEEEEEEEEDDFEGSEVSKKVVVTKSASSSGKKKLVETKITKKTVVKKGGKDGNGGQKWTTLEHNGVMFPPAYQPHGVKMLYNGEPVDLTPAQEEVATMYAVMKDTDYATQAKFNSNFWQDWKKILGSNHVIKKLELCDFTPIYDWYQSEKEKKKQLSSAEKKQLRDEKAKAEEKYTWALVDGVKEKVGNFRVEPPGLFRGRGQHPKMGKLKRRIFPENIVINIGKGAPVPECPMPGHNWKEIRHDNTVTWLAFWNDPINEKEFKYVFLHPSSSLKAQSDMKKYEKARQLKDYIDKIRKTYTKDFGSTDPTKRQIAVATYLIDRLALRAGNEKDDDEADTVGCCSLKVEHVKLLDSKKIEFDFLGKDSIRYLNEVAVEEKVFKAIGDFQKGKKSGDDLFDRLDTNKLNAHLKEFMPELTAKVFRTYNASITLDNQLEHTDGSIVPEKIGDYQRANKEVAVLCNHQRTVSKSHGAQMEKLEGKMAELKALREEIVIDLERARKGKPPRKDEDGKTKRNQSPEQLEKKLEQTDNKIQKMELDMKVKDDLKTVALGTSKINYLDPRITVAWCKRNDVPIEKIFTKSLLQKFTWALEAEPTFRF